LTLKTASQCECGLPPPHRQREPELPPHEAGSDDSPPALEAKTDSFLDKLAEPHFGQGIPSQRRERTSNSLSAPHS